MTLTIHDRSRGDRTRAVQLINKTNQFNLNGSRVTDEDVAAILQSGGRLLSATLSDRSGSHGEILACLVTADSAITALVLSCRVFQRRVEYAFLAWLASQPSPPRGAHWASTPRNAPLRQFLGEVAGPLNGAGLVRLDPAAITTRYARDVDLFAIREE
jgi:FkbH-like protein